MSNPQPNLIVMFADVSDSSRLFERLGDTEATYAVERCLKRMDRAIAGYGGEVAQVSSEGLLAVFSSAEKACLAAIDMQTRVSKLPPVSGLKVTIRIGLHIGKIEDGSEVKDAPLVQTTGKIAARARIDQILASTSVISALPGNTTILSYPMPALKPVEDESGQQIDLAEIDWSGHDEHHRKYGITVDATPSQFLAKLERLCVRYHGTAFLLDENAPFLTMGRDPSSTLLISDRKASRLHGRIERRNNTYYYVDSSTNGTFVTNDGQAEVAVRRREIELKGKGRISFGASSGESGADFAEFEHL